MMGRYSYDIFPLKISHAHLHILLMLAHKINAENIFRYLLCNFLFYCKRIISLMRITYFLSISYTCNFINLNYMLSDITNLCICYVVSSCIKLKCIILGLTYDLKQNFE